MAYDRFLIGPMFPGEQTNLRPYAIPDEAFAQIKNAYVWRGRIRKRPGARVMTPNATNPQLNTRLSFIVGTTDGSGDYPLTALTDLLPGDMEIGQVISVGGTMYTVTALGNPASLTQPPASGTVTLDTTTPSLQIAGAEANATIRFFLTKPVMGFATFDRVNINRELTFAFDTRFAYKFNLGFWERLGTGAAATWTGADADFFWSTMYQADTAESRVLYVTNFVVADYMRYWNDLAGTWTVLRPLYIAGQYVNTARIIIPFKNRLVLLNTNETVGGSNTPFPQRARWSQSVNFALNGGPTNADAFRQDLGFGRGSFADASTTEAIVSAFILKDRLIVEFERSHKELVFTNNQVQPFKWQDLNNELGAESTFSVVPFDKVILSVGNVGIQACNGANVERIDELIPQEVFRIHNGDDGPQRVHGIRDYTNEMVYWTFPSYNSMTTVKFPQRILCYNYATGSWAFFDDSITTFGYFQQSSDLTWGEVTWTWGEWISSWGSGSTQADFRSIIAGNQEGYTFLLDSSSLTRNCLSLSITNIGVDGNGIITTLTVIRHNLQPNEYILIDNILGDGFEAAINGKIFFVLDASNPDQITVVGVSAVLPGGTYYGGGTIERVSRIDILTKQYNFYAKDGANMALYKMDMMVDRTDNGQFTIDYMASSSSQSLVEGGFATGAQLGTNILKTSPYPTIPFEASQERLWHPVYFLGQGEVLQMRFYLTDTQMKDLSIVFSNFVIHQFVCYVSKVSRLQ